MSVTEEESVTIEDSEEELDSVVDLTKGVVSRREDDVARVVTSVELLASVPVATASVAGASVAAAFRGGSGR